jgi:hypothetical protein
MRVLVTGSRLWLDFELIRRELDNLMDPFDPLTVIHGACRTGADAHADLWARQHAFINERHPAEWKKYGRAAGPIRNMQMVALGADEVLAFILDGSKGATHCADAAEEAGLYVRRFTA